MGPIICAGLLLIIIFVKRDITACMYLVFFWLLVTQDFYPNRVSGSADGNLEKIKKVSKVLLVLTYAL